MKIRTNPDNPEQARQAYRARYRRRGMAAAHQPRQDRGDGPVVSWYLHDPIAGRASRVSVRISPANKQRIEARNGRVYDHAIGNRPNHAARYTKLPLVSIGAKPKPIQRAHPVTTPMSFEERRAHYLAQTGRPRPTRRQLKRLTKQRHHNTASRNALLREALRG